MLLSHDVTLLATVTDGILVETGEATPSVSWADCGCAESCTSSGDCWGGCDC